MDRVSGRTTAPRSGERGVTLAEMLAIVALLGLVAAIGIPLISEQVQQAEIRSAADQYVMTLKAARMLAVSNRRAWDVDVQVDPANTYTYVDARDRPITINMPDGVRIVSSTNPISFQIHGSLPSAVSTVIEADLSSEVVERWTVTAGIGGVPTVARERIEP